MLTKGLSKNKVILSDKTLNDLGFIKEDRASMDQGTYQTHVIKGDDSFIEITNEFNEEGQLYKQYADIRIINEGLRSYDALALEMLIKRFLK